ncbi:cytochrome c peroxidase [uncultured Polaribacter sp.]|uniref:cytochrome-c peroxidase n=1 Tax=uncultured Polaribacter sp. TaxID=174711 RepID=UPI0026066793|nr:cytochrome c peroxidase [uncultured Polaribacter sp.]
MKIFKNLFVIISVFTCFFSCNTKEAHQKYTQLSATRPSLFTKPIKEYYFKVLDSATFYMQKIDTLKNLEENQNLFLETRKWYKKAEPLLIAYDYENYLSINAPNLLKVEIEDYTEIKKLKPKSYQVLEEYLFGDDAINNKDLFKVYNYLSVRLPFIRKNHILIRQTDTHHLQMIRDAIVNIATKGITGFDSPMLANSLQEAIYNYETIASIIDIYATGFLDKNVYNEWKIEINKTIATLKGSNFNDFDRYSFIKNHTNKQLTLINKTALEFKINLNSSRPLNPKATNLFSKDFFNITQFGPPNALEITPERVALGKQLFNDTSLSKNNTISCASCHKKEKAFTDGKTLAIGENGKILSRNTPTLAYTVYQKSFFYDGRSGGLENQIVSVTNNENEFHTDLNTIVEKINKEKKYLDQFNALYNGQITNFNVRNAIATYVRSLTPFNSKFDRNLQNKENTLTLEEQKGFNLFMGKAACATCHFPPSFYGTVPPKFNETEFENLGVTKNDDFSEPILDEDLGLYFPFKVDERKRFFKTSTVRNAELTAPYMHNGAYKTLEKVLEFYNNGGGAGMGLEVPYQTLPVDSLNLDDTEIKAIIQFIKSLTDKEYEINNTIALNK